MSRSNRRGFVVTGGGTAGHVVPALAVADALVARGVDAEAITYVGSRRGMEVDVVAATPYRLVALPGRGIRRSLSPRALLQNAGAVLGLAVAVLQALWIVLRTRPAAVVSVGGYAAAPASLAAVLTRRPLVLVNVDAVAGAVNRLTARFAAASAVAMGGTELNREVVTGAPLRPGFSGVHRDATSRAEARRSLGLGDGQHAGAVVAFVGGSLGAGSLNALAQELATTWHPAVEVTLYQVAGRRFAEELSAAAASGATDAKLRWMVVPFEEHMRELYLAADVVVSRAGAMTVAELAATGTPSLLAPLPGAPNDHQRRNAERLVAEGAARIIDPDLPGAAIELAATLDEVLADPAALAETSRRARSLAPDDAAGAVADLVLRHAR